MKKLVVALAVLPLLALLALVALAALAAVPATAATQSFTFCSGSETATFGIPDGEGPTTIGLGPFGARDPVTDHGVVVTPVVAITYPVDAVIIEQKAGWGLVAGSQWISYGLTNTGATTPLNGVVVTFTVDFILPTGATAPELKVTTIQDDNVDIYLNDLFEVNHAGHTQASQLTRTITGSPPFIPGNNQLRFDVEQTGGDGFGLDYCATVSFMPGPTPTPTPTPTCSITVTKQTIPAGGTGFAFSSAWSGLWGITLNDGQSITKPVGCGPIFNVFETPQPGWALTNIACTVSGAGTFSIIGATANATADFEAGDNEVRFWSLTSGSTLQCTFTNTAPVGGTVELRGDPDAPVDAPGSASARDYTAPIAAAVAAAAVALTAAGWYARRRWLR